MSTAEKLRALTEEERRAKAFQSADEANAALKSVQTEADFRDFEFRLACTDYYRHVELVGKRRGYETQAFTALPWNPNKAHYLYCDGASTGRALWKNLYRVLEVRMWQ